MSRINTNVSSLIASRVLNTQTDALTRSLERLSTGVKINRGADDPAGLIASESLRGEKAAIQAAISNAGRAANVLSVAEAGLQEISSLLLSLEDLVDRTSSQAGLSKDEVRANQLEIDSILSTINRIAGSTSFNGEKLLDGSLGYTTSGINSSNLAAARIASARIPDNGSTAVVVQVTQSAQTAQLLFAGAGLAASNNVTLEVGGIHGTEVFSFAGSAAASAIAFAINQTRDLTGVSATASATGIRFNSTNYGSDAFITVRAISGTFTVSGGSSADRDEGRDAGVLINGVVANTRGLDASVNSSALGVNLTLSSTFGTALGTTSFYIKGGGAGFAIAPSLELSGRESLGIDAVTPGNLGNSVAGFLSSLGTGQTNQLSAGNFAQSQRIIRASIDQVSSLRGRLGAFQRNTLESTVSALGVALENTTAAESAIRDTDFAEETSRLTRAQILVQSATQILQLANAAPQSVLSLLR